MCSEGPNAQRTGRRVEMQYQWKHTSGSSLGPWQTCSACVRGTPLAILTTSTTIARWPAEATVTILAWRHLVYIQSSRFAASLPHAAPPKTRLGHHDASLLRACQEFVASEQLDWSELHRREAKTRDWAWRSFGAGGCTGIGHPAARRADIAVRPEMWRRRNMQGDVDASGRKLTA